MAHELTHIANRDVMVMTLAAFFASLASMIVQFGFFFGGGDDDDDDGPGIFVDHPRLAGRLRDLVLPHAGAVALPRVRRRPRRGGHHRPPERAVLGAVEDQRDDGAHPADRPARPRRDERVLHLPRRREEVGLQPLLDAPADGEAHRRPSRAWRRSCRARPRKLRGMGFLDALLGKRKVKGPAPDRLFAISTAYVGLEAQQGIKTRGVAGIVFQPLATGDFRQIVDDMQEVLSGTGSEMGSTVETKDDEFGYRWMIVARPRHRGPRGRRQRGQRRAGRRRLQRPRAGRRLRLRGRRRQAAVPDLQLQARQLVPVRARAPATSSATPSASCRSRRPPARAARSSPSSSAGSPSGGSPSEPARPRPGRRAALRPARAPARARRRPRPVPRRPHARGPRGARPTRGCPSSASTATTTRATSSTASASRTSTCAASRSAGCASAASRAATSTTRTGATPGRRRRPPSSCASSATST